MSHEPAPSADKSSTKPNRKKSKGGGFRARTTARLGAVQVLYELEMNPDRKIEAAVRDYLEQPPPSDPDDQDAAVMVPPDTQLLSRIVRGTADQTHDLDAMIDGHITAPWSPDRIELLLRCVLRAGAYELLSHGEFDTSLVIKEYMAVTDGFFSEKEPKLVNAVLDRLAKALRG
ncbi:MAG: transcription antitermination factor NusB [Pseudomonadota bacterium]